MNALYLCPFGLHHEVFWNDIHGHHLSLHKESIAVSIFKFVRLVHLNCGLEIDVLVA